MARIQPYRSQAMSSLLQLFRELYPGAPIDRKDLASRLDDIVNAGGMIWILEEDHEARGYAEIIPVPSLPGLFDLSGGIAGRYRRHGLGTRFLNDIKEELTGSDVIQLVRAVHSLDSPRARFLLRNGFHVEHEEIRMEMVDFPNLPIMKAPPGMHIASFSRSQAVSQFRNLYEKAFEGLAWYQPYLDDDEVSSELDDPDNLLFLVSNERPVGCLWLRWSKLEQVEIEPLGIIPGYQGRGHGRLLLLEGLDRARQMGARKVTVGFWTDNTTACRLYTSVGFKPFQRVTYLAFNVN